jgi:hypothetical protein
MIINIIIDELIAISNVQEKKKSAPQDVFLPMQRKTVYVKPNMCNYFPLLLFGASLRYLIYLLFFPSFVYVHSKGKCISALLEKQCV